MAYPTTVRRATAVSNTTNSTTWTPGWTWNTNTAISSGDRVFWYLVVTADGAPTITQGGGAAWTKVGQATDGTSAVTAALFKIETTAAYAASSYPTFQVSSTASEQYSAVIWAVQASAGSTFGELSSVSSSGSSTNSNPAAISNIGIDDRDCAVLVTRSGDSTVTASAAPSGYGNLQTIAGGGSNGASSNSAEIQVQILSGSSEDPGTFTSANEQWVCWTAAVYEISTTQTLTPSLVSNSETFYAPTVSPGAVGLTPGLETNSQTFYGPTALNVNPLTPSLVTNSEAFYAPIVTQTSPSLNPSLVTNSQTFYAPTVSALNTLSVSLWYNGGPELVSNGTADTNVTGWTGNGAGTSVSWFSGQISVSALDPVTGYAYQAITTVAGKRYRIRGDIVSWSSPSAQIRVGTAAGGSTLGSVTGANADFVFTASGTTTYVSLVAVSGEGGAVFDNISVREDSVLPAVVTTTKTLTPSLVTNSNTFYAATVNSNITLAPSLVTNSSTLYAPTVTFQNPITPALFTNSSTFYAPTVSWMAALLPSLVTNSQTFYGPAVSSGWIVAPSLVTNSQTFYGPVVTLTQGLTPSLVTNSSTFYAATVTTLTALTPSLVTNSQTFYTPTVTNIWTLSPPLVTNSQTFYSATVSSTYNVTPALFNQKADLVVNGTFVTDVSNWTAGGDTSLSFAAGDLRAATTSAGINIVTAYQLLPTTPNQFYTVQATASTTSFSSSVFIPRVRVGPTAGSGTLLDQTSPISTTEYFAYPTTGNTYVTLRGDNVGGASNSGDYTQFTAISVTPSTFFPARISRAIYPSLVTNSNTFYSITATSTYALTAPFLTNTQTFYNLAVSLEVFYLQPPLVENTPVFYEANIAGAPVFLTM